MKSVASSRLRVVIAMMIAGGRPAQGNRSRSDPTL